MQPATHTVALPPGQCRCRRCCSQRVHPQIVVVYLAAQEAGHAAEGHPQPRERHGVVETMAQQVLVQDYQPRGHLRGVGGHPPYECGAGAPWVLPPSSRPAHSSLLAVHNYSEAPFVLSPARALESASLCQAAAPAAGSPSAAAFATCPWHVPPSMLETPPPLSPPLTGRRTASCGTGPAPGRARAPSAP